MNEQLPKERYDTIGIGYDSSRKADPYLTQRMFNFLRQPGTKRRYLDIGSGTGNYTSALHQLGLDLIGVEPSDEMLSKARAKNPAIHWMKGYAEDIPIGNASMDGVLACLTIHHWKDINQGFSEVSRVLKKEGTVVIFTTLPEQTRSYWLHHYFPQMMEESADFMPAQGKIKAALEQAGLEIVQQEPYFVQPDLEDRFLYSGKHQPERYFNPAFRQGISSFSLIAHQAEVDQGLAHLRVDIDSGKIAAVQQAYENSLGDYLFIIAQKT
ncbi:MAG: methyltransferase domain-containing protein [Bacteroidota bacterium]